MGDKADKKEKRVIRTGAKENDDLVQKLSVISWKNQMILEVTSRGKSVNLGLNYRNSGGFDFFLRTDKR